MSDTAGLATTLEGALPGSRPGDPAPRQDDGASASAVATSGTEVAARAFPEENAPDPDPRFVPGQRVELAVQVGSWPEGTPCEIICQDPTGPYEWRVWVERVGLSRLEASMYEHELRPGKQNKWSEYMRSEEGRFWQELYSPQPLADGEAPFEAAVHALYGESENLLLSKHRDYGPRNVSQAPGGPLMGLAVRLHDKLARLTNLLQTGEEPNHESLRDTMLDVMGYGAIGVLVCDGNWPNT